MQLSRSAAASVLGDVSRRWLSSLGVAVSPLVLQTSLTNPKFPAISPPQHQKAKVPAALRLRGGPVTRYATSSASGGPPLNSTASPSDRRIDRRPAVDPRPGMVTDCGIKGWGVINDAANPNFSHGRHILHDTLRAADQLTELVHFVSEDRSELVLICSPGWGVCGHKDAAHGGFIATLFDNAFATLGMSSMKFPVTSDIAIKYLLPLKPKTPVLIRARIASVTSDKKGREKCLFEAAMFPQSQFENASLAAGSSIGGKPIALGRAEMIDLGKNPEDSGWVDPIANAKVDGK